jgi:hypothetical protein
MQFTSNDHALSSNRNKVFSTDATHDGFQEDFTQPLSWRDEPETSLSDWTIEAKTDEETRTFHVHRAILGAGSRKCQYFTSLFQSLCLEHENNTSRIEFASTEEIDEMESLLDFAYSGKFVPGDNAVVARYLALYFQNMEFMNKVNQFVSRDLTPKRAPWYLLEAMKYNDDRLIQSATTLCAQELRQVSDKDLQALPVDLFQKIIRSSELECGSRVLSLKVHAYISQRPCIEDATPRLLYDLTKDEIMPELDGIAARGFLRLMKTFNATKKEDDDNDWSLLRSLAKRCTDSIALNGWKTMDVEKLESDFGQEWDKQGEWHQKSDFALLAMSSALARAQEVCTMQEWEIQNLRAEVDQSKVCSRDRSLSPSDLNYFNNDVILEALDATIEETVLQTVGDYLQNHQHWTRDSSSSRTGPRSRRNR